MLIGVVSDTHVPSRARHLPARLIEGLHGMDLILHAGDLTVLSVLDELAVIAPVEAVHGNVDGHEVRAVLPRSLILTLGSMRVGLVHGDGVGLTTAGRARRTFADADVQAIVFGHSHTPFCAYEGGILMFNPGSPTDRRREPHPSFGVLRIGNTIEGEIRYL